MDRTGFSVSVVFILIMLIPTMIGAAVLSQPVTLSQAPNAIDIAIVGEAQAPAVNVSLTLDQSAIILKVFASVAQATAAAEVDVIVLVDTALALTDVSSLDAFLTAGGGLLLLLGPQMTANGTGFQELGISQDNSLTESPSGISVVTRVMNAADALVMFDWSSAPPVERMTYLPALSPSSVLILAEDVGFGEGDHPLLVRTPHGDGDILTFTPWLTLNSSAENAQTNYEIVLWPYFNYFLYSASLNLGGETPFAYAEWAYSPVPHEREQLIIGVVVLAIGVVTVTSFMTTRKRSKANKEALVQIEKAGLLVETKEISEWEEIGMHRQLGGFLIQLFMTLIIIIPRVVLSIMIYPVFVMPFPQAAGWWSFSQNLFLGLWTVFDLGTMVALVKYFAEYRVSQPEEAIKYAQIFVWFQCLTGVVQITLIAFLGSIYFPHTYLAHLSWIFIAHSLFQFPGFTLLFAEVFRGMNRIDMQQIITILYYAVFSIVAPYTMIIVFRWWGAQNPIYGEALGGAIGQAVGSYLTEWITFGVSIIFFKRLGLKPGTLFRVDFGSAQVKKALKFGLKWTIGAASVPMVWFYQMLLISTNLLNWSALQGQYQLAWDLAIMVSVVGLFMEGMLGGVSESYSHGKKKLTELYTAQGLKYGAFFVFWLVSALAAVGWRAILGAAGEEWALAADFLWFFLVFQLIGFWSWLGDWMFAGAERTGLAAIVWILEQVIRAIAMTFFVVFEPVLFGVYLGGMRGIIVGYCIGLVVKDIAAWVTIRHVISAPKLYVWQSYIGPGLAAIMNFIVLETVSQLIWTSDMLTSALIFFLATFPSLYMYSFFSGLSGTWDDRTLKEFKRASAMVRIKGIGWLARRFYGSISLGARVSPLHNRYPIEIYDEAMAEAEALTREKKQLVI